MYFLSLNIFLEIKFFSSTKGASKYAILLNASDFR